MGRCCRVVWVTSCTSATSDTSETSFTSISVNISIFTNSNTICITNGYTISYITNTVTISDTNSTMYCTIHNIKVGVNNIMINIIKVGVNNIYAMYNSISTIICNIIGVNNITTTSSYSRVTFITTCITTFSITTYCINYCRGNIYNIICTNGISIIFTDNRVISINIIINTNDTSNSINIINSNNGVTINNYNYTGVNVNNDTTIIICIIRVNIIINNSDTIINNIIFNTKDLAHAIFRV